MSNSDYTKALDAGPIDFGNGTIHSVTIKHADWLTLPGDSGNYLSPQAPISGFAVEGDVDLRAICSQCKAVTPLVESSPGHFEGKCPTGCMSFVLIRAIPTPQPSLYDPNDFAPKALGPDSASPPESTPPANRP